MAHRFHDPSAVSTRPVPAVRVVGVFGVITVLGTIATGPATAATTRERSADGPQQPATALAGLSGSLESLAEKVSPAVVQVFTTTDTPGEGIVSTSGDLLTTQRGSGSGVILDPAGYIVTNAHVVRGARRIQVELASPSREGGTGSILRGRGRRVGAQLVGVDLETDLAVLKVSGQAELSSLPIGDSDALQLGQLVMAFGSPLGFENSVSLGVVSAVARQLRPEDPMIYLQTDAPINPGSSGGPLVNTRGELVGVNTLIVSQSGGNEGIGFAAPANIVRHVYEQIKQSGRVARGEIGARVQTITPTLAAGLGLPRDWGVVLADVTPGGMADQAGLRVGDIVLTLDGKVMENGRQFNVNLYRRAIGEVVALEILRNGERYPYPVPVAERPGDPQRLAALVTREKNLVRRLGILGLTMDAQVATLLPSLRLIRGVVVAATAADAPASATGGFLPGDVIHAVNRTPIESLADLHGAVDALGGADPLVVQVERFGQLLYLTFVVE